MLIRMQRPETLRPDAERLRGIAIALMLSVPLWAAVIGIGKVIS